MQAVDHRTKRDQPARNRLWGALATVLYALLWVLLVLLVTFRTAVPRERVEEIPIEFGQEEETTASSGAESPAADVPAYASQPEDVRNEENRLTQRVDDAPSVPPAPTVDRRALFPGSGAAENASGGASSNSSAGRGSGVGSGVDNDNVDLGGRSLVGVLPKPEYPVREEGRVVIDIRVDQQGHVTRASFRSQGSTTTNSILVQEAQRAALKARFNVDETAAVTRTGTITYIFKLQ